MNPHRAQIRPAALRDQIQQLESAARALEPGASSREQLRDAIVNCSEKFLRSLEDRKAFEEIEKPGLGLLDAPVTEDGLPMARIIEVLEEHVIRPGSHPASGGHLAYFSGGGIYHAALAEYLSAVTNKYGGLFFTGPGVVRMENLLVRWVADLVGYPATAGGCILSGGSLANLTAIAAAREAHRLRAADVPRAVVYLSDQTHHSIHKALRITGMEEAQMRPIPIDRRFRMLPDALAEAIAADRARGLKPWLIAASAGTTDTGAVDPLDALATIAERESCWLHIDAAYGGFFLLTEQGRRVMRGIERSDSAILNPHKSFFQPWGTGILVVRDVAKLTATFSDTRDYLQDARDTGEISPADISPELTRPFRALRLWLPLVQLGTKPFHAALDEKLLLARYFHHQVQALGFEVSPQPDLSIVTFRWHSPGVSAEHADRINHKIHDNMRRDGRVFFSSTRLAGRFTLRMAATAHRTHLATIDLALQELRKQVIALTTD